MITTSGRPNILDGRATDSLHKARKIPMNPPIDRGWTAVRLMFELVVASCFLAQVTTGLAQTGVPVITTPADLHFLDVNTGFDTTTHSAWTVQAPMPTARAGFATASGTDSSLNPITRVYVMGGAVLKDCTTVDIVEAYDPASDTWISSNNGDLQPIPPPLRWRPTAATLDNVIYIVGGGATDQGCGGDALATIQAYHPATNTWITNLPSMSFPRLQVGVGVDPVNHLLYAVGGIDSGPLFTPQNHVEVFDPAANNGMGLWTTLAPLNTARGLPAVIVFAGKVYAVGGQTNHDEAVTSVEQYDPISNAWTTLPSSEPSPDRTEAGTVVLNGKVYVLGGTEVGTNGRPLATTNVYDPATDTWAVGTSMPTARRDLGAAGINNTIYAIGGGAPAGRVGEQFTYQITATNSPTEFTSTALPPGLTLDNIRGIISGVPTSPEEGFLVTFTASNDKGTGPPQNVSFYFAPHPSTLVAPNIISSSCVTGRVTGAAGQPFTYQVLATNASPNAVFSATGLPYQQLSIDPGTGLISGIVTPAEDGGVQNFGVQVALTDGTSTAQSYLEFTFVTSPLPVIDSPSTVPLILNQFFFYQITADAHADSFDFLGLKGLLNQDLPGGLVFDRQKATISGVSTGRLLGRHRHSEEDISARPPAAGHSFRPWLDKIDTIKKEPPPHIQLFATDPINGTGTAPLNFVISLHDFEAESLADETSPETPYVVFSNDPLTSNGSAGLLEAAKVFDFVTYTVPVNAAGTYDVKIGIKTDSNQGMFQLAIDGSNQGLPQNEYSPVPGYNLLDLGPVTFAETGNHAFQFQVSGRDANSSGYQLIFDYIDLDPHPEVESLPIQTNSPYTVVTDPNLSGGKGILLQATSQGESINFTVPVAVAGIYDVSVGTETNFNEGVFQLAINGTPQGYPQNEFTPTLRYGARDLGTVTLSAGPQSFQFTVAGRDPQSGNYKLAFDYIELTLATHFEAEKVHVTATAPLRRITDANMSGQSGIILNATNVGDLATYRVPVPVAGTYDIKVGVRKSSRSGIFQLAIDGTNQGSPQDTYSAGADYTVLELGRVTFSEPGNSQFQFSVTGKNGNSNSYQLIFDYINLVR